MKLTSALASFVFLGISSASASAATFIQPPDLNPGDLFRIIFVTSTTRDATSTNIADYDTFVNNTANANGSALQGLGLNWLSVASVTGTSAVSRLGNNANIPIYRPDGVRFANSLQQLWQVIYLTSLSINEQGNSQSGLVWTGTTFTGGASGTKALGSARPETGSSSTSAGAQWIQFQDRSSDTLLSLYGISDPTSIATPEPASFGLILFGAAAIIGFSRRKR
jgi:hypothetical protein